LWAIARESRKERNRETAGTLCGKVTPRYPAASGEKHARSCHPAVHTELW
jgi:hypothetical protein